VAVTIRPLDLRTKDILNSAPGRRFHKGQTRIQSCLTCCGLPLTQKRYPIKSRPPDRRAQQTEGSSRSTAAVSRLVWSLGPLRYMHPPAEVLDLGDLDESVKLMCAYIRRLTPEIDFTPR
jgi:hypothetical protein